MPDTPTRAAIITALRQGLKTPGSIVTAAKLGATVTYQELEDMVQAGLVERRGNGAMSLTTDILKAGAKR